MSFFSKLFGGGSDNIPMPVQETHLPIVERPEVKESDFIDTTDPNEENVSPQTTVINYGTDYPIDVIYIYIQKDWETEGYNDALENSDIQHMNSKVSLILNGLRQRIDLTKLNYDKKIRNLQTQRTFAQTFGLVASIDEIDTETEILKSHLEKIKEIEDELAEPKTHLKSMLESYQRGFANGVAKRISETIKQK